MQLSFQRISMKKRTKVLHGEKALMKNIFVDANIIIDLLANRKPFSKDAIEIFDRAENI